MLTTITSGSDRTVALAEKSRVVLNGFEQGMFLRGDDVSKPVLLYLHGGLPGFFWSQRYRAALESEFVVCWWEQRGSGLSYRPRSSGAITSDQLVADTVELARYLQRRFDTDRIYLMGHSGGTFLGMLSVARAPELFHAYVAVSQMASQLRSETQAYDYLVGRCRAEGRTALAKKLEAAPVTIEGGVPDNYLRVRDKAMHTLGVGTTREMHSVVTGLFLPSLRCRDYTLAEKINLWRAKAAVGVSSMWAEMLTTDLAERVPEVEIPVYFLHGIHDYTCTYAEASRYFQRLTAPLKGFYTFDESAHSPHIEETDKAMSILRDDILKGTNRLADSRTLTSP